MKTGDFLNGVLIKSVLLRLSIKVICIGFQTSKLNDAINASDMNETVAGILRLALLRCLHVKSALAN